VAPAAYAGRILALLTVANVLNFYDRAIPAVVVEPVRLEFGLTDSQVGVLSSAFIVVYAIAGVLLGRLADACDDLRTVGQVMVLRMPPTFAARWFLPRLPELRALMADVDIRITTHDAWAPAFDRSDVDAAVVRGVGQWPGVEAILLMREVQSPVCSPAIAARLRKPADIAELPLLHTDPIDGWERWMRTQGLPVRHARRGQTFDTLELALAAATRGQGVVMSDLILAEESLRDGVLVQPFAATIEEGIGYYLVYPPERATQPKIRLLREWMLETAQGTRT